MNTVKRLSMRRAIILLVLASFVLAACGRSPDTNWPGLAADAQGVVYVAYGPAVLAIDVESNQQLWSFVQGEGANAPVYAPPTVVDGQVVFGDYGASGGFFSPRKNVNVYSLDASDGSLNSNWPVGEIAQDRIVAPALLAGDRIFIGTADNQVFALDANTAQAAWPNPFKAEHSIWGKPAYKDGIVYVPSLDRHVYALDASDGSIIWETSVGGSVSDKVVSQAELVYVSSFDKQVYALDSQNGEVKWTAAAEDAVWGAPAYDDGMVYFADLSGHVFAADAESGEILWQESGAGYVVAQPVIVEGKLIIASAGDLEVPPDERTGELIAYDLETRSELWRRDTDKSLFATPVVVGDKIVVAQSESETLLIYFNFEGLPIDEFRLPAS